MRTETKGKNLLVFAGKKLLLIKGWLLGGRGNKTFAYEILTLSRLGVGPLPSL